MDKSTSFTPFVDMPISSDMPINDLFGGEQEPSGNSRRRKTYSPNGSANGTFPNGFPVGIPVSKPDQKIALWALVVVMIPVNGFMLWQNITQQAQIERLQADQTAMATRLAEIPLEMPQPIIQVMGLEAIGQELADLRQSIDRSPRTRTIVRERVRRDTFYIPTSKILPRR